MNNKTLVFIIILLLLLTGCIKFGNDIVEEEKQVSEPIKETMIEMIETEYIEDSGSYRVYVDKETKVMYLFTKTGYGGGLTVMLNPDGSPKLYQGE